jgi:hypothetical protein
VVRKTVIKTYKTKKNYEELVRLFSIPRATIGNNKKKVKFMELLKIEFDPDGGQSSPCATKSNVQGG